MEQKGDRIRFETWVEIESIREKQDIKGHQYWQFVSTKQTRFLCWDFEIYEVLQQEINDETPEKHHLQGFINIVHGGTFLVVDKNNGTRAEQIQQSIRNTVEYKKLESSCDDDRGTCQDEGEILPY